MRQYDVCVVSFSDLNFDARSINLIKTCAKINLKVLAISVCYESQKTEYKKKMIISNLMK